MGLRAIWSAPDQTSQANTNDERAEKETARVSVRANWVPPTPPTPPSIIGINSNVVIYINKFGGAMGSEKTLRDVNLSKIAEGGFSAVAEPSLETDTVLNCTKSVKHSLTCWDSGL
jgi:hypothetical protein